MYRILVHLLHSQHLFQVFTRIWTFSVGFPYSALDHNFSRALWSALLWFLPNLTIVRGIIIYFRISECLHIKLLCLSTGSLVPGHDAAGQEWAEDHGAVWSAPPPRPHLPLHGGLCQLLLLRGERAGQGAPVHPALRWVSSSCSQACQFIQLSGGSLNTRTGFTLLEKKLNVAGTPRYYMN